MNDSPRDSQPPPWSRPYSLDALAPGGRRERIEADSAERSRVAAMQDLEDLTSLAFDFVLTPLKRGRVRVQGRVEAAATQSCVVTLEPVAATVSEEVDIEFWPAAQLAASEGEREIEIELEEAEPLEGDALDLGQLGYEVFAAALDPYPRMPGATLDWTGDSDAPDPEESPFAALKHLRRR